MAWYGILGWGIFWISFIVAVVLFASYKKLHPVMYMVSISLYIFSAGFLIDVFNLPKIGILMTLVFSACLFMVLGYYFSKVFGK